MPRNLTISRGITVAGQPLDPTVDQMVESLVVEDRRHLPDTCVIEFFDPDRVVIRQGGFEIGKPLAVSSDTGNDTSARLFDGEITSIETNYDASGSHAVVRAYDRSHRLAAGRRTATYQNVSYSEIAQHLATDAGLQAQVDDSGTIYEHVLQPNVSDLDFLAGLARRIGYWCLVQGDTLHFERAQVGSGGDEAGTIDSTAPEQLVSGNNLLTFRARITAVAQVEKVRVRGWDVTNKEVVVGEADGASTSAVLSTSIGDLATAVGSRTMTVVTHPVATQAAADQLATAAAEQIGGAAFEATAEVLGSPSLRAGSVVNVSGVEPMLEGRWVVTTARHEFNLREGYRTRLEFAGRQDRTIHGLLAQGGSAYADRIPGAVIAIVTDNDDPESMGRVKVKYPWLDDNAESWWARLAQPGAGKEYGMVWIPQVGDEVLVIFEQGSVTSPVVIGGLWNGQDTAPLGDGLFDAGSVKRSGFISRKGHKLVFFDAPDDTGIALISSDNKFRISLNETSGKLHIYFDGDLVMEGTGDVEVKTQGDFKVEAAGVTIQASGNTVIKGATVALN